MGICYHSSVSFGMLLKKQNPLHSCLMTNLGKTSLLLSRMIAVEFKAKYI